MTRTEVVCITCAVCGLGTCLGVALLNGGGTTAVASGAGLDGDVTTSAAVEAHASDGGMDAPASEPAIDVSIALSDSSLHIGVATLMTISIHVRDPGRERYVSIKPLRECALVDLKTTWEKGGFRNLEPTASLEHALERDVVVVPRHPYERTVSMVARRRGRCEFAVHVRDRHIDADPGVVATTTLRIE